jgi:uncharacterized membrane protein YhaH (DUF805 family)
MQWYLKVLKNYISFSGRATRQEYWMFYLFNLLVVVILEGLALVSPVFIIVVLIYTLGVMLPSWAATVRRLHDTARSGWWIFISMIPLVGAIILIVFLCQDSDGPNIYGSNLSI